MGSADAPAAAATVEGPTAPPGSPSSNADAEGGATAIVGADRPYGNVPSWSSSSGLQLEETGSSDCCSGNGAPPYTLSIAPMVREDVLNPIDDRIR